jgi:hypothetical protein
MVKANDAKMKCFLKKSLLAVAGFLYAWMVLENMLGWVLVYSYQDAREAYFKEHDTDDMGAAMCYPYSVWGGARH